MCILSGCSKLNGGCHKLTAKLACRFIGNDLSTQGHIVDVSVCINNVEHCISAEAAVCKSVNESLDIDATVGKESVFINSNVGVSTLNHAGCHTHNCSHKSVGLSGVDLEND